MSPQGSSSLGAAITKAARLVLLGPIWVYRHLVSPMLPATLSLLSVMLCLR